MHNENACVDIYKTKNPSYQTDFFALWRVNIL